MIEPSEINARAVAVLLDIMEDKEKYSGERISAAMQLHGIAQTMMVMAMQKPLTTAMPQPVPGTPTRMT